MGNFFKSLFGNNTVTTEEANDKDRQRKFDILKYDGLKAMKMGKVGYAIRCFNEALNFQEEFETLEYLAQAYIHQGKHAEAIDIYNRLTNLNPEQTDTFLKRAQLYLQEGQDESVITDCQYVLNHQRDYRAYLLMAHAQNRLKLYEDALSSLTKAAELKNDMMDIFLLRSSVYYESGKYDEALEDINRAIILAPEEETAFMQRAKIYESFHNKKAALQDYATVTDLNPFYEQAYLETGRILMENQQIDEAISYFDEALEIKPDFGRAFLARGEAKKQKGDQEGALIDLETGAGLCEECEEDEKHPVNFDNMYTNRPI